MNRRQFLATGVAASVVGVAGCLGDDDELGQTDGYGPEPDSVPEERTIDTDEYETMENSGIEVPLAPIEDVHYWYQRQEARIADTRGEDSYGDLRIAGAALSPYPDGGDEDPVADWDEDDRIVTYCVCPHAMAVGRATLLIQEGYENVYALDEGLEPWVDAGYSIEGAESDAVASLTAHHVEGRTDPSSAGEPVTVSTVADDRSEMSLVDDDGSYELTLHFANVDPDSLLEVETPDYTRELTLEELTSDVVTA